MAQYDFEHFWPPIDFADLSPHFRPFRKTDLGWETSGSVVQHDPDKTGGRPMARHSVMGVSVGRSDNVAVSIRWRTVGWDETVAQVGPVLGLLNPNRAADPNRLGWGPVWDIGVHGKAYMLSVFDCPEKELLWSDNGPWRYKVDLMPTNPFAPLKGPEQHITLFAMKGKVCVTWNNKVLVEGMPRPEWTLGRDFWGVRVIENITPPGNTTYAVDPTTGAFGLYGPPAGDPGNVLLPKITIDLL